MWRRGWSHRTVVICCARVAKWQKHLRATQGQGCCPLTSQSLRALRDHRAQHRNCRTAVLLVSPKSVPGYGSTDLSVLWSCQQMTKGRMRSPRTHDRNPNHHQTASKLECHQVTASHRESVRNEVPSRRCPKTKALHACVQACLQTAGRCGHPHPERPALRDSNFCASVRHT